VIVKSGTGNNKAREDHVEGVCTEEMEECDVILPFFGRFVEQSARSITTGQTCPAWIVESVEAKPGEEVVLNPAKKTARKKVAAPKVVTHTIRLE